MKQIERIERMERYLDESSEAVRALSEALERYEAIHANLKKLSDYYGSTLWMKDYEDGEAGKLYRITLGGTSVSAAILVDGEYLCDLGMTPMTAYVPAERLVKGGRITVAVSNTAADEILAKQDVINSHPAAEVGGYAPKMLAFESRRHPLRIGSLTIERPTDS